ncbi:helix-turn-helix domain-containing protein, partial [Luteibacter sp.]|uniref:helix-turn-helix domain-containing protein n=1 Tax=Luteibacter sp. TaxID=1886636 RepID=UPI002F41DD1B
MVVVTITNNGDSPVTLSKFQLPFDWNGPLPNNQFDVRDLGGFQQKYIGDFDYVVGRDAADFIQLQAHQSIGGKVELRYSYSFDAQVYVRFKVRFTLALGVLPEGQELDETSPDYEMSPNRARTVQSNELQLTLDPTAPLDPPGGAVRHRSAMLSIFPEAGSEFMNANGSQINDPSGSCTGGAPDVIVDAFLGSLASGVVDMLSLLQRVRAEGIALAMEMLFTQALGLVTPWRVVNVDFQPSAGQIVFKVENTASRLACPACAAADQPVHDRLPRRWQHLNFFQFKAIIQAQVPRVGCRSCEKTTQVAVPWARPGSGFSQTLEAFVVALCSQMPVAAVARLLGVSDERVWRVLDYHVAAARAREDYSHVHRISADERSARKGQRFLTLFCDLDARRLLFATQGRDAATFKAFAADL